MNRLPHLPEGYHSVTPSLTFADANAAIEFYKAGLGAVERFRFADESTGKIKHGEIQIGDSAFMFSSEFEGWGQAHQPGEGPLFVIYVEDCNASFARAVEAGATVMAEPEDQFWGDRAALIADPHGYRWEFVQRIRQVPIEEIDAGFASWNP